MANCSLSFREAHGRVAALVKYCSELGLKKKQFSSVGEEKLAEILGVPITSKEIADITDPGKVLSRRKTVGFPNPKLVEKACKERTLRLRRHEETLQAFHDKIERAQEKINFEEKVLHRKSSSRSGRVYEDDAINKCEERRAAAEVKQ